MQINKNYRKKISIKNKLKINLTCKLIRTIEKKYQLKRLNHSYPTPNKIQKKIDPRFFTLVFNAYKNFMKTIKNIKKFVPNSFYRG